MFSVTVITPIYNRKKYVAKMIKMLKAQTLSNIEFIVVDDGSSDGSFEFLQKATQGDKRFILLQNNSNQGPSAARNKALQQARGKYIGFFDCDDKIPSDYFASLYEQAENSGADIVYTVYNDVRQPEKTISGLSEKIASLRNGALWDKLYKTSLITQNNLIFAAGLYCADNLFAVQAIYYAKNMQLTNQPIYQYALHSDSIGKDKGKTAKRKADILSVCAKILDFAHAKNWSRQEEVCLQQFLAKSFNEYQKDQAFRAKLENLLNLISIKEQTMYGTVEKHSKTIKLFCLIPIYGWKQRGGRKVWKILGLPIFKIRKMSNGITTKYYILGLPVMKVSRKTL